MISVADASPGFERLNLSVNLFVPRDATMMSVSTNAKCHMTATVIAADSDERAYITCRGDSTSSQISGKNRSRPNHEDAAGKVRYRSHKVLHEN
jgi:hypothetical protein